MLRLGLVLDCLHTPILTSKPLHFVHVNQASKFIRQNNILTTLIQDVNTMAGYQKEILPSTWSPTVKYSVYN